MKDIQESAESFQQWSVQTRMGSEKLNQPIEHGDIANPIDVSC